MNDATFKERVFELAFGDDAINKGYSEEEVLTRLAQIAMELPLFEKYVEDTFDPEEGEECHDDSGLPFEQSEEDYEFYERLTQLIETFKDEVLP